MRSHSYLNTSKRILGEYNGSIPLAAWLKEFFRRDKKYGSKDRKQIGHLCYCYYRLGNAFRELNIDERILIAVFLCSDEGNIVLEELKPEWNEKVSLPVDKKIAELSASDEVKNIFPFEEELSSEIDKDVFFHSFLVQPDLYLRIRPGKKEKVLTRLQRASIEFDLLDEDCVQLSNQTKADQVINMDEDAVVQDYNSQKALDVFKHSPFFIPNSPFTIWDCCAASGGKSILAHDHFPHAQLTVSDVRESILINLRNRFKRAGINSFASFIADVSSEKFSIKQKFDLVICDAPCSGSGTWSRTPEQLSFFQKDKIDHYANLQRKITVKSSKALKSKGHFLYITCSVFKKENEDVVKFIEENTNLRLLSLQYLKGYDKKADTLFTALFAAS